MGGIARRNHVDVGSSVVVVRQDSPMAGLLASKDPQTGGYQIAEDSFFAELTNLLKKEYVDPIEDETKLATGAIRGMVSSLGDVHSFYMDKEEFAAYTRAGKGELEGIGADLALRLESPQVKAIKTTRVEEGETTPAMNQDARNIPVVTVTAVAPGSPAAKAGVQPGDWIESVNGHVVISPKFIRELNGLRQKAADGKLSAQQLFELNQQFQDKVRGSIMPWKGKEKLVMGTSGKVTVSLNRNGSVYTREIEKGVTSLPALAEQPDGLVLRFQPGVSSKLGKAVAGKEKLTIDLRNSGVGSYDEMKKCLAILAPDGVYGSITTQKKGSAPKSLSVKGGNAKPPKMTLIVDKSTRGPAEVFALALSSRGFATLKGEKMGGVREVVEVVSLPDGSGYTLVTGTYETALGKGKS